MTPSEVCWRVREVARRRSERRSWRQRLAHHKPHVACDEIRLSTQLRAIVPGVGDALLAPDRIAYSGSNAFNSPRAVKSGAGVVDGSWSMLGHDFDLRGKIEWHQDPRSNYRWPRAFFADLSLYDLPDGVDVKYVWELGRQQYIVELARAWLLARADRTVGRHCMPSMDGLQTRSTEWAEQTRYIMLDWIEQNPLHAGVHWTSALEVAMRAISWIWALATLLEWDGWEEGELQRIAASLANHATYLEHHFSVYSSPYNHLIGEAAGLYLIGIALGQLDDSKRWRRRGREVLLQHTPKQFYEDGFCVEQAIGYHFYTLGFLTLAIVAARNEGEPLHDLEPIAHRAYRAGAAFRQPNGRWPGIGDIDSARSIPVHHDDFWDFNSLCSLGAVLFDDAKLITSDDPGDELFWLLGCAGVERWRSLYGSRLVPRDEARMSDEEANSERSRQCSAEASLGAGLPTPPDTVARSETGHSAAALGAGLSTPRALGAGLPTPPQETSVRFHVLRDSGYAIATDGNDWLLFDAGPIAAGLHADATPSAAHGHADTLQVLYWLDGEPILHDCGMPFYAGPVEWVQHFRGPAAHNTIQVEGAPLARHAGHLAWSHVASRPMLEANMAEDMWLARGCAEWKPGVVVERHLLCLPGEGLWIADWIQLDRPREIRWYWQLPVGTVQHDCVEPGASHFAFSGSRNRLAMWSDTPFAQVGLDLPHDDSPVAWRAEDYGVWSAAQRVRVSAEPTQSLLAVARIGHDLKETMTVRFAGRGRSVWCEDPSTPNAMHDVHLSESEFAWYIQRDGKGLVVPSSAGDATVNPAPPPKTLEGQAT